MLNLFPNILNKSFIFFDYSNVCMSTFFRLFNNYLKEEIYQINIPVS